MALPRTDRPDSVAEFVGMFLDPTMVSAWGHLDDSVRTGRVTFDDLFGSDFFGFLAKHPELSRAFNASMRQGTRATAAILTAHPHLRGVLFDSPQGSAESGPVLDAAGVTGRCEVATGDFFAAVPAGTDVYLLKSIVHDWDDDRVVTILGHIRAVIPPEGRLLIIEPVLPETVDGSLPPMMYVSDFNMLVNGGGRERTEAEFRSLCERAGFFLAGVTRLPAPAAISVIEAVPA
ncbi:MULTISPECIES: methyltransferase [unclassified Streptomyces]|uniref:methyltransferase n=1 Tax=unclassified Streptomyces TaxID=2593676 RepID=UPI00093A4804|nr:methyltransferase [Streptomyces sp. TSRI0281]OKI43185.1 hypothetical protein A6A29_07395 [Streptomyces sp. TSRI0281]